MAQFRFAFRFIPSIDTTDVFPPVIYTQLGAQWATYLLTLNLCLLRIVLHLSLQFLGLLQFGFLLLFGQFQHLHQYEMGRVEGDLGRT